MTLRNRAFITLLSFLPVLPVLPFLLASLTPAHSENQAPAIGTTDNPVALVALSQTLFEFAHKERDPYMLITAAKLRKRANLREQAMVSEEIGGQPHVGKTHTPLLSWQQMLDVAVKYARGNPFAIGLIDDLRALRQKGVVDGAVYSSAVIKPRGKRRYSNIPFEGGEFALVYSVGQNEANIDMHVFNAKGHIICSQTDPSVINQCGWTPKATTNVTVVLQNNSDRSSGYSLVTN